MAGFKFRLQSLLNVKRQMEDNLKLELAQANRHLKEETALYDDFIAKKREFMSFINNETAKGVKVEKLIEYNSYLSQIAMNIEKQKEKVIVAQDNADKHRERLIKIMQEKKMLEKLKQKKLTQYKAEETRREQKNYESIVNFALKND